MAYIAKEVLFTNEESIYSYMYKVWKWHIELEVCGLCIIHTCVYFLFALFDHAHLHIFMHASLHM